MRNNIKSCSEFEEKFKQQNKNLKMTKQFELLKYFATYLRR